MARGRRIFVTALLFSLALHLMVAGNAPQWWTAPAQEIPFPIEAHLLGRDAPPPPPHSTPKPSPAAVPQPVAPASADAAPASPPITEAAPAPQGPIPAPTPELTPSQASSPVATIPSTPVAVEPAAPPPRALRGLPERLSLRYAVQAGEEGFNLGQAIYTWLTRDGRYSLVNVTEATGITALFVSGKIIQTSEGLIAATGLQPEQFWIAKGDKKQPPVRMDWTQKRLLLPSGGVDLPVLTQDLLSFPFHLAMTVQNDDGEWRVPITNGKKLRLYDFRVVGRETLNRGEIQSETLHLRGERTGEGSLDVWLAPAHHWLPARIRTLDQKGKAMVLNLEGID